MLKDDPSEAERIGKELTTGYADHGWCITVEEASKIGLAAVEITETDWLDVVWEIHRLQREKERLIEEDNERKMREKMTELPADLQQILPSDLLDGDEQKEARGRNGQSTQT